MHLPSAPAFNFNYPSYKRLELMLGRIDAIAALTELLIKKLLSDASQSGGIESYLPQLAREYRLNLTHVDTELLPLRSTQLQIVSVHQVFAEFLTAFKREHPLSSSWEARREGETPTEHVWRHVIGKRSVVEEAEIELKLCEYYRSARNRFLHTANPKQPKLENLRDVVKRHPALKRLDGPSAYQQVKFDDIIIFSRSALGVSRTLCENSLPTDSQIIGMVEALDGKPAPAGMAAVRLKDYRKFKNNFPRLYQALENLLHALYGVERAKSERIAKELASRLLA